MRVDSNKYNVFRQHKMTSFNHIDAAILNRLQRGFPISSSPYQILAEELNVAPEYILQRIEHWLANGVLTRFGPLFHIEKRGGEFTLCALHAPKERFDEIAALVNAEPSVAHNYERTHYLNMWFVLATEQAEQTRAILAALTQTLGVVIYPFPKLKEYFVGLYLPVQASK